MISYRPITGNRYAILVDQFVILIVKTEEEAKRIIEGK